MARRFQRLKIAAVVPALALGIGVVTALAATSFPDPAGDVQGGRGPDLTSITVSHTATAVTFRVRFAKAPPLAASIREGWVDMLLIGIDVPPRSLKCGLHGCTGLDYYAGLHGTQTTALVVKAQTTPSHRKGVLARPKVTVSGRTLGFSVSRRELGNPAWIELVVFAGREASTGASGGGSDSAPNRGTFHYELGR